MSQQELVRWIIARMRYGYGEGERMWIIFDRVHQTTLSRVDFQYALTFVRGEMSFHDIALLAIDPLCLGEGTGRCCITTFEEVTVRVMGVGVGSNFSNTFDIAWDYELNMDEFEVLHSANAGIIIDEA